MKIQDNNTKSSTLLPTTKMSDRNHKRQKTDGSTSPDLVPDGSFEFSEGEKEGDERASTAQQPSQAVAGEEKHDRSVQAISKAPVYYSSEALNERLMALEEQVKALVQDNKTLNTRLDNITGAFEPAIDYALLETAVNACIAMHDSIDENIYGRVKYGVASAMGLLLEFLVKQDSKLLCTDVEVFKRWSGPGKGDFPKENRLLVIIQGLHGLLAFVEKADSSVVLKWSPMDRNGLAHNGSFLDAVVKTPDKNHGSN